MEQLTVRMVSEERLQLSDERTATRRIDKAYVGTREVMEKGAKAEWNWKMKPLEQIPKCYQVDIRIVGMEDQD